MATVKTNQGLFNTSDEEVRNLAKKKGLVQPPDNPLETAVVGANPDQAKMAGTPAQVRATALEQLNEKDSLQTAERTQQVRKDATEGEQQTKDEAAKLQGLGTLDSRVQEKAQKLFLNQQEDETASALYTVDASKLPTTLTPEQSEQASNLINKVAAGTASNEELVSLNKLLGHTDINSLLSAEEIKGLFVDDTKALGTALATQVPDSFTIGELDPVDLGFSGWDDMATTLGVSADDLQKMSVPAFTEAVKSKQRSDFAQEDKWKAILADPTAPADQREEARRILREMGATGVREADRSVDKLAAEVEAGNTVTFLGREMTVEELLNDDTVAGIVKEYFEDPSFASQVAGTYPELDSWIKDNQETLKGAAQHLTAQVGELKEIQEENKKVGDFGPVGGLTEQTMKVLFPDYGELTANRYEPPKLLTDLKSAPQEVQADTLSFIEQIASANPDFARDLASTGLSGLMKYGAFDPERQADLIQFAKDSALFKQSQDEGDPWGFVSSVFDGKGEKDLQDEVTRLKTLTSVGKFPGALDLQKILDRDRDGKLDDPAAIQSRLGKDLGNKSFTDILTQGSAGPSSKVRTFSDMLTNYAGNGLPSGNANLILAGAVGRDGSLNMGSLTKAAAGADLQTLSSLMGRLDKYPQAKKMVESTLRSKTDKLASNLYGQVRGGLDSIEASKKLSVAELTGLKKELDAARQKAVDAGQMDPHYDSVYPELLSRINALLDVKSKADAKEKARLDDIASNNRALVDADKKGRALKAKLGTSAYNTYIAWANSIAGKKALGGRDLYDDSTYQYYLQHQTRT